MARRKTQPPEKRRPQKKKVSILSSESITYVDYKDVNLLRRFMSERAKIRARRVTGNSAQQQREVARAIRVAREMALLPYAVRQVTTRRGGRRDRDREPRPSDAARGEAPTPDTPPPSAPSGPPPAEAATPDAPAPAGPESDAATEVGSPEAGADPASHGTATEDTATEDTSTEDTSTQDTSQ